MEKDVKEVTKKSENLPEKKRGLGVWEQRKAGFCYQHWIRSLRRRRVNLITASLAPTFCGGASGFLFLKEEKPDFLRAVRWQKSGFFH
jgi:hypothetical protein